AKIGLIAWITLIGETARRRLDQIRQGKPRNPFTKFCSDNLSASITVRSCLVGGSKKSVRGQDILIKRGYDVDFAGLLVLPHLAGRYFLYMHHFVYSKPSLGQLSRPETPLLPFVFQ